MTQSRMPEFGNWDDEDVPYSQVFDVVRKNRAEQKMNQDKKPYDSLGYKSPKHEVSKHLDGRSPRHEAQRISREEVEFRRRLTDSPLIPVANSPYHHHHHHHFHGYETPKRTAAKQTLPVHGGFDHSPLHPQQKNLQKKTSTLKGSNRVSSPSYEGSHSLTAAPSTPGRTRLKQITRGNETYDQSAIPRFGDWDETDPTAAVGFTEVFGNAPQQRQDAAANVPTTKTEFFHSNSHHQPVKRNSKKCGCFPWPI